MEDGELPFANVLSEGIVAQPLAATGVVWLDRIYSPLVTLWVFLGQVLSADHSCRAAVVRLIAHAFRGENARVRRRQAPTAKLGSACRSSSSRQWPA
jgi:hypothetical protein